MSHFFPLLFSFLIIRTHYRLIFIDVFISVGSLLPFVAINYFPQ